MLETIAILLFIAWLFGFVAFPTVGSLIHILLVLCLIAIVFRVFSFQNPFKK